MGSKERDYSKGKKHFPKINRIMNKNLMIMIGRKRWMIKV